MKEHSKKVLPFVSSRSFSFYPICFYMRMAAASPVNNVCAQDITKIELVVQFNTPDILQSFNNVSFTKSVKTPSSFISRYLLDNKISPPPFNRCQVISAGMKWRLDFPAKHIISILQKNEPLASIL